MVYDFGLVPWYQYYGVISYVVFAVSVVIAQQRDMEIRLIFENLKYRFYSGPRALKVGFILGGSVIPLVLSPLLSFLLLKILIKNLTK